MTNPATILSFAAVFAGLGLVGKPHYAAAATLVLGVFVGSAMWWLILSGVAGLFRRGADERVLRTVNRLSGAVIFAFGLYALVAQLL